MKKNLKYTPVTFERERERQREKKNRNGEREITNLPVSCTKKTTRNKREVVFILFTFVKNILLIKLLLSIDFRN